MNKQLKVLDTEAIGSKAQNLRDHLLKRVVGQDEAVEQVMSAYQTYLAGMACPGRPIANFLFLGPTGTGKTRMVEAAAESLLGDARAMIKIDCAEFAHSHEIAKLIGSPPGYLGHRETHPILSQKSLDLYHTDKVKLSFVLFDEIEKASDTLWNLLLGILDKGTLTLGDNRRVDFSRTMIVLTSNLGATEMAKLVSSSEQTVDQQKIVDAGLEAARRNFTPEFMNRIDKTVVFFSLGEPELRKILDLEISYIQQRILQSATAMPFMFKCTANAKGQLLREGTSRMYGARHLKRVLERRIVQPFSNLIMTNQVTQGDRVVIDLGENGKLLFQREMSSSAVM